MKVNHNGHARCGIRHSEWYLPGRVLRHSLSPVRVKALDIVSHDLQCTIARDYKVSRPARFQPWRSVGVPSLRDTIATEQAMHRLGYSK